MTSTPQATTSQESSITLAGKTYAVNEMSEQSRQLVAAIRSSEDEIKRTRNQLALMDVGRRALMAQLRLALENPDAFLKLQNTDSAES
ncbi:MAG: DUF6447 family protein [Synechococcus sp.]|nr:DUF6447 family protein [Synechococcus sp.]